MPDLRVQRPACCCSARTVRSPSAFRLGLHCPLSSHCSAQLRQLPPLATVWKSFTFMNMVDCSSTQYPVLDVIELMTLVSLLCIITLHYHMSVITTRSPATVGFYPPPYRVFPVGLNAATRPSSVRRAVPVVACSTWRKCRVVLDHIRCVPHSIVIV